MNSKKRQNECLNFIKGCACFSVLYMHTNSGGLVGTLITCLSRYAVLIFFMISGYYCFNHSSDIINKKYKNKILHIIKICLFSTIVYFIWSSCILYVLEGKSINIYLFIKNLVNIKSLVNFVFFNQVPFGGTLWFLFALLYCYIIMWVIDKLKCYRIVYILSMLLIIIHIVSRGVIQYYGLIDESRNIVYYRNFIFMGFPFFMMGNFIHRYEEKLKKKFSNKQLIILIISGLLISCLERYIVPLELYWGTTLATFCIYIIAIKNPEKR